MKVYKFGKATLTIEHTFDPRKKNIILRYHEFSDYVAINVERYCKYAAINMMKQVMRRRYIDSRDD